MADQLTSIGVEFNRNEMARIFYSFQPKSEIRPWGLGRICASHSATSYPDRIWNTVTWPVSKIKGQDPDSLPRLPGLYKDDEGQTELVDPNEFIHPCVRIRLDYKGLDLDDARLWNCRALSMNGYNLMSQKEPSADRKKRDPRVEDHLQPYYTVAGVTLPFFDGSGPNPFAKEAQDYTAQAGIAAPRLVEVEQPWDEDLHECKTPEQYWVWKNEKTGKILEEEHIGIWERMYAKVNAKKLEWAAEQLARDKAKQADTEANRWAITKWAFGPSLDSGGNGKHQLKDVVSWQTANLSQKPPRK